MLHTPKLPSPIHDARQRFCEIYQAVRADHGHEQPCDWPVERALLHVTPSDSPSEPVYLDEPRLKLHYLLIPGLVADCLSHRVSPFNVARAHLHAHGFNSAVLWVNGRSSSAYNARMIAEYLQDYAPGEEVVLLGYSKGAVDALQAIVDYPAVCERTRAVVSLAGAVQGSPLAENVSSVLRWLVKAISIPGCQAGDGQSIQSLHPVVRRAWLEKTSLPSSVRYFSLAALPEPERVSRILRPNYRKLAKSYGDGNDSQVLWQDALIPGSDFLGYANVDHWALTLPLAKRWPPVRFFVNQNDYPREILLESIVRFIEERLLATAT